MERFEVKWPKAKMKTLIRQEAEQVLKGWKCIDGEDYCSGCWGRFLDKIRRRSGKPEEAVEMAKFDSAPVLTYLESRRCLEGLLVVCEDCGRAVLIPTQLTGGP